jgi:hypothetical protein
MAGPVFGASASFPSTVYQPGRYLPLRVEAESAGVVKITGEGIQPVDWHAAGRSAAVVPLLVVQADPKVLVDGKLIPFKLQPLAAGDVAPPELDAFWQQVDPKAAPIPIDPNAHALARLWQPGLTDAQRRWMLTMIGVSVLLLAVARHARPKRAKGLIIGTSIALAVAVTWLFPIGVVRRTLRGEGQPGWDWVWFANGPGRVSEPWVAGLRTAFDGSPGSAPSETVLNCDANGRPSDIEADLGRQDRVVMLRPR